MRPLTCVAILLLSLSLLFATSPLLAQEGWTVDAGDSVWSLALSADGSVQVVGSRNNRVAAYRQDGALLWEFHPEGTVWGVAVSGDGAWTAVASEDRHVYLLDAFGEEVWRYRSPRIVYDVAMSNDGSRVVAIDEGRVARYFDRASGDLLWETNLRNIADAVAIYGSRAIRPIFGTRDSQVLLYSPEGQRLWRAQLDDEILSVDVSSNGATVVAATMDGEIALIKGNNAEVVWQMPAPDETRCNPRQRNYCLHLALGSDGGRILLGTRYDNIFLLDSADGSVLQSHPAGGDVSAMALSADGEHWLIATRDGQVRSWTATGAAAAWRAAQDLRRNLTIGIPAALALLVLLASYWVRRTDSGRRFWQVTSRPTRILLLTMWRRRIAYVLLTPTVVLLLIFNYYPALSGLYHSFTDWNPTGETLWVGWRQFDAMFNSNYFWVGMKNAAILALSGFLKLAMPLLVAELIFHIRHSLLQYLARTLFIVPLVVPSVVGILIWVNIYDPTIGLLNQTLISLGLEHWVHSWLGERATAMPAIVAIGFPWISAFALLIIYGGLIGIPQELFDAAKVDGATWWKRFTRIDLPMLLPQFRLLLILTFIASMQEFQLIFLTTGGGPSDATYTPALELYYNATLFSNFGLASAMGTFLFIVILGGTILNLRYVRSQVEYEA